MTEHPARRWEERERERGWETIEKQPHLLLVGSNSSDQRQITRRSTLHKELETEGESERERERERAREEERTHGREGNREGRRRRE